jgi:hypothetical protein
MWSDKQLVDEGKMKKFIDDNAQNNKAFMKMRDIISAWKYHQDKTTKDILKKQSDRVAAVMNRLEDEIKKKDKTYTKIGLKAAWDSFMKARAETARARAEETLDTWLKYMNDAWMEEDKSSGDESMSSGDENSDPNKGANTNSKVARLAKLKKERESMGTWSSPL